MKLLMHTCCAPCACYPTEKLTSQGIDFTLFFYNPNIHPFKEFKHRLETLREFVTKKDYQLIINKNYHLESCLQGMLNEPGVRCSFCYRMRLSYAAAYAKNHGYDAFTTTLLVSPYQKHDLIKQEAMAASREHDIPFYYEDYREGYERGVQISLDLGLYRQPYCGCVFSERDRYYQPWRYDSKDTGRLLKITKNISEIR